MFHVHLKRMYILLLGGECWGILNNFIFAFVFWERSPAGHWCVHQGLDTLAHTWSRLDLFLHLPGKVICHLMTTATICHHQEPKSRRVGVRHTFLMCWIAGCNPGHLWGSALFLQVPLCPREHDIRYQVKTTWQVKQKTSERRKSFLLLFEQ